MTRKKPRGVQKQQLTNAKAVTRDYQPIMIHHWGVRPRDLPIFTFLSIQAMLYDPTIRLGLAMRAAPVYQAQFGWKEQGQWQDGVQCKNDAVKQFLDRQLQRIWQQDVNLLVRSQLWGHTGGEVMLRLSEDNLVEVDGLLDRHPNDVRALKRGGKNVGVRISRLTNRGALDLEWPKAYWTTYNPEAGCFYGTSVLIGAYSPWYDKWCDGGALDVRRLYMHKDAYVGCSIYYPEGDLYTMPDGSEVPARDLARQMIEQIVAGGVVALPSDTDEKGNKKWELKPATVASNPAHILKYPQDLDTEMLRGIEVPDDIFTADSTSSGAWAGKKVPLSAFYAGLDSWVVQMTKDLTRCIFEPLVLLNFGKAIDFTIGHKPLAEQAMEQQNQPQGQPPGQPGAEDGMPGMPGMPGGDEGGGGGSLADLLGSPAAQQARQGGGQPQQMSLDAAIGRGVVEAAAIVKASRETLDAALVRMASDTPREGDRNADGLIFHNSRWHREDELPGASKASGAGASKAKKAPEAAVQPEPTVSNEAHVEAFQRGDKAAAERLLKQNGGLVYQFAKKFAKHHVDIDDLQQEARIALLSAAKAFDPSRGFKFSTLAVRSIVNRLSKVTERAGKRQSVWNQTPEDKEGQAIEPVTQPEALPTEEAEKKRAIMDAVNALPERTKHIVTRRYGLDGDPPATEAEIAEKVGLSKQRVNQIVQAAEETMKASLQQWAMRMAAESNPWTLYKGARGGIGWTRADTKEVRYQKDRPGAHEGAPGQQPGAPSAPAPKTPQELESALQAVAADPAKHGLHEEDAAKLKQAKTTAEKIAVLDEATGHKFDKSPEGGQPAAQAPVTQQQPAAQMAPSAEQPKPAEQQPAKQDRSAEDYAAAAQANLQKISRTAQGKVDTSASKEKAGKMQVGSGAEAARLAQTNFAATINKLYASKDKEFIKDPGRAGKESVDQVLDFADSINKSVNQGITKEGVLLRTDDSPKYPYTSAAKLDSARKQFGAEFLERLKDVDSGKGDAREMAAWIHWRLNMTDHPYADGVGKTAEAMASWVLMRAGEELPKIESRDAWFASANRAQVDPDGGAAAYYTEGYKKWLDHYGSLFSDKKPLQQPSNKPSSGSSDYGVRGGWPWKEPAPSHDDLAKKYAAVNPNADDTWGKYKKPGSTGSLEDRDAQYTPERQALHKQIVEGIFSGKKPVEEGQQPVYTFLGGGTAAGKSTALRSGRVTIPHGSVHIDADDIKNELPDFQRWAEDRHVGAAGIAHEESSDISKDANRQALDGLYHTVMDGTGDTSLKSVKKKVDQARAAGHKVVAHYMTNDIEKAFANATKRASSPPYRMVSAETTLQIHANVTKVFHEAVDAGLFDEFSVWDTNGNEPVLVCSGKGKDMQIHDQAAYQKFRDKANLMESHKHLLEPGAVKMSADEARMPMEDVYRIAKEVAIGREPQTPDGPQQAAYRARVQAETEQMKAKGQVLDIPHDWV